MALQVIAVGKTIRTPEDAFNDVIDSWNEMEFHLLDEITKQQTKILRNKYKYLIELYPNVLINRKINVYQFGGLI